MLNHCVINITRNNICYNVLLKIVAIMGWPIMFILTITLFTTTMTNITQDKYVTVTNKKKNTSSLNETITKENESIIINNNTLQINNNNILLKSESLNDDEKLLEKRAIDNAIQIGLKTMQELVEIKEPKWHKMGLFLENDNPASRVEVFGAPISKRTLELSKFGFASLEASRRISQLHPFTGRINFDNVESRLLLDECPLTGLPRCTSASRLYRTSDGTCNNFGNPWRGSANLPMLRFLSPAYHDGIQSIRRSVVSQKPLPSARDISVRIHHDKNTEQPLVTLMFMQWGQFIDHDITSTVKSRSFNGTIPRCCNLPLDLTHPNCLPIAVSSSDWFLSRFNVDCLEFVRSAPSTRINCDLGWREQINQVTSYLDASTIYGSDVDISDSIRTFRGGKLRYGRSKEDFQQLPDPPGLELCRAGALMTQCFQGGDGRLGEQIGLTAMHTIFLRYHNKLATVLGQINEHWSDEKVFQETRRIIGAIIQHITYREFLPLVLGQEVMDLFELHLVSKGYFRGYDERVNPAVANGFSTAAFRFGHSMVQNSYVRSNYKHRPIFNNVSLHEEEDNLENILTLGSIDRLLLGFCNQPSQRRDEFICDELTNHLFQTPSFGFGMDLAAINIQRGRDHGLPAYTSWRTPCGLSPINSWSDLSRIMDPSTLLKFQSVYEHVKDIDLFSGGLAEKPVRGGIVGPTFACIIAQQFSNLRKGDRFWYENDGFESSFTPAQLQQIRHVTLAQVLCHTLSEIETVQPFVFLAPDSFNNNRLDCDDHLINNFDVTPWTERDDFGFERRAKRRTDKTKKPNFDFPDVTYFVGTAEKTTSPVEVNIKIQYYPPTPEPVKQTQLTSYPIFIQNVYTTKRPTQQTNYLTFGQNQLSSRPNFRPQNNDFTYLTRPLNQDRPYRPTDYIYPTKQPDTSKSPLYTYNRDETRPVKITTDQIHDKLDFRTRLATRKFVKISSVKGDIAATGPKPIDFHVAQREGDLDLTDTQNVPLLDLTVLTSNTRRWVTFNATIDNITLPLLPVPDLNDSFTSKELPKPINIYLT